MRVADSCDEVNYRLVSTSNIMNIDKEIIKDTIFQAIIIPDDQFMSVIVEHCLALLKTVRSKKLIQGVRVIDFSAIASIPHRSGP